MSRAWVGLLRGHAVLTRELNAQLVAQHGLTINDYEVLLRLARAPEQRLRRVDLANDALLTASGITRLLDGLERCGYVQRGACAGDRRVVYAVLTEAGLEKLESAADTHLAGVQAALAERFSEDELETLGGLLTRLADADGETCAP